MQATALPSRDSVAIKSRLQVITNAHICAAHHMPQDSGDRMRGHGALLGAVDTTIQPVKVAGAARATVGPRLRMCECSKLIAEANASFDPDERNCRSLAREGERCRDSVRRAGNRNSYAKARQNRPYGCGDASCSQHSYIGSAGLRGSCCLLITNGGGKKKSPSQKRRGLISSAVAGAEGEATAWGVRSMHFPETVL